MRSFSRRLAAALLALAATVAAAADRQLVLAPTSKPPAGEKRFALVIGNSAYKIAPLRNPVNDARAIAKALAATGFSVTMVEDASQGTMRRAIRTFGDELGRGGIGVFYYAGHGVQVKGKNYLIPVNADIEREDEVEDGGVDAALLLSKMERAQNALNVVILDACRNNPFTRSSRSAASGLAQMDAPSGTLVAFATAPGSVAADGDGANGVYTKHLLANLASPGLPVEQLFKQVRIGVTRETGNRQVPWESSSLTGNFYFVPGEAVLSAEQQRRALEKTIEDRVAAARAEEQRKMEKVIRDLLAKQRAELEEELNRRGEKLAAAPATASPQAERPLQVAAMTPGASIAATRGPRLPQAGDRWEYVYVDSTTRVRQNLEVEVTGVSSDGILENGTFSGGERYSRVHAAGVHQLTFNGFWDFSPYLAAFDDLPREQGWPSLPATGNFLCSSAANLCRFDGRVVGAERVTTAAGTFDALKVVVEQNLRIQAHGGWRQLTFWYSEKAKRVVKSSVRTLAGSSGTNADYDLQLVSYKLN